MQINRREVTLVLSKLLGFVGVDDTYHGHRVGFMVWRMSDHLQLPEDQRAELVEAGLLHDIGVSSTVAHQLLLRQIDVPDAVQHCVTGEAVIASIPTFSHLAPLVRHHHEHWKRFDFEQVHPLIALFSNLIFLADRLDILMVQAPLATEEEREQIIDKLVNLQDLVFAPQCIEAMLAAVEEESFWEVLHNDKEIAALLSAEVGCCSERTISFFGLQEIAHTFSHVVDAKSPFTHQHSQSTADVAELLGGKAGFPHAVTDKIKVAGLFHDIGKLRVPDEILEKPGRLDPQERKRMERHPQDSWEILRQIGGMEDVAEWTWMHHEKLNGKGYPRGLIGDEITHEAQILTVADIFQALMQKRPYRASMGVDEVFSIMDKMVERGEISGELLSLIKQSRHEFVARAAA